MDLLLFLIVLLSVASVMDVTEDLLYRYVMHKAAKQLRIVNKNASKERIVINHAKLNTNQMGISVM